MDNKNKFNTVKIATCNDAHKAEAVNQLFERSLLFNRSDDICGIVISKNDEKQFIPISAIPDNVNIEKREGVVTLVENPVVDSITTKADHNGIDWKSQRKIAETSAERTIILLCTKNTGDATNIGVIGGEILEVGEGIYGHYQVSLTSKGSGLLEGATTFEQKAALIRAKYNGTYYYGIKFKSTVPANIYFAGWDHFPEGADAPLYTSYNDADLSEIVELDDTSDIETTIELSITVDSWAWNDYVEIFAYVWTNGLSNGSWVQCSGSGTTVKLDFPSKCNRFFLVRCPNGTTQPDWNATNDNPGQIYNKTPNITYVKGTTSYSTHFGNPDKDSLPGGGMTEDEKAEINGKIGALQSDVSSLQSSLESVQKDISALQSETYEYLTNEEIDTVFEE